MMSLADCAKQKQVINKNGKSSNFFMVIEQMNEGLFRGYFKAKTKGRWDEIQCRIPEGVRV